MSVFFCYVNVLIRQRTSSFSSEDHSFTDNASERLLISTTGGQCPAKDGSNTEMFLQVWVQSRMRRSDFAQVHRLAVEGNKKNEGLVFYLGFIKNGKNCDDKLGRVSDIGYVGVPLGSR